MISALIDLIGTFYQSGDFGQVEVLARTMSRVVPDDVISVQILGLMLLRKGRDSAAQQIFSRLENVTSANATQSSTQCESAASVCFREATRRGRGFARLWYDLGVALARYHHTKYATKALRTAIAVRPAFPEAGLALAALGLQTGDLSAMRIGISAALAEETDRPFDTPMMGTVNDARDFRNRKSGTFENHVNQLCSVQPPQGEKS